MGFEVLHLYGTTESYGPPTYCAPWRNGPTCRQGNAYAMMARQGHHNPLMSGLSSAGSRTTRARPVPRDGATMGESHAVTATRDKGYLGNATATDDGTDGGLYHSGRSAVWHPGRLDRGGSDRSKDISSGRRKPSPRSRSRRCCTDIRR